MQQLLRSGGSGGEEHAIGFFSQALASDGGFSRAQAGICRAELKRFENLRNAGAFDNARVACLRASNMDPTIGEASLALGDLYRVQGDLGQAIEYYGKLEQDPAVRPAAHVGLAKVYAAQGRQDVALKHFQQALQYSPGNADIYAEIGYQQYLRGRVPDAIESYRKAVDLRPDDADLWSTLGGLHLTAGNNAAAAGALERSVAIEPSESALSNLGTLKYQAGDYAAAAELHRRATVLNPGDFLIWGNLAEALLAHPATAAQSRAAFLEAASRAQRYVQIKSDDAKALAALGWYRANLGQGALAREMVERSEALAKEQSEVALFNAETFALLGDIGQSRRRVAAARAAGIAEKRITTNTVLRRTGVVLPETKQDRAGSPALSGSEGHPPGG